MNTKNNYKESGNIEVTARATGKDIPISTKHSIEICNLIRGTKLNFAKKKLDNAINMKEAIPFKRYTKDLGHKKNIAAGRFAVNACSHILTVIKSAEANARNIGLDLNKLIVKNITANKAARPFRHGRRRRIKMKRTHVEVILGEDKK